MKYIYLLILILSLLSSCGTLNQRKQRVNKVSSELKDPLTYEQRRKFDYYFLEAVRMKQKGEYYIPIVWIYIRSRLLFCMRYHSFICFLDKRPKEKKL